MIQGRVSPELECYMGISLQPFQLPTMPLAIAMKSFYCYHVTPDAR